MPVEDIDFLSKNSEQDGHLLFVDSSTRNKEIYPYPSEYEVRFTQPYTNVIGIEILDSMIPYTMYTIDIYNDLFKMYLVYLGYKVRYNDITETTQNPLPLSSLGVVLETVPYTVKPNLNDPANPINEPENILSEFEADAVRPGESFETLWNHTYKLIQPNKIDTLFNTNKSPQFFMVYDQTAAKFWICLDPTQNRVPVDAYNTNVNATDTQNQNSQYYGSPSYLYTFQETFAIPPNIYESTTVTNKVVMNLSRVRLECNLAFIGDPIDSSALPIYDDNVYMFYVFNDTTNNELQQFWNSLYNSQYYVLNHTVLQDTNGISFGVIELVVYNYVYLTNDGWSKMTTLRAPFTGRTSGAFLDPKIQFVITNTPFYIERGNYDINSFASYLNTNISPVITYTITDGASTNPFSIPANDVPLFVKSSSFGTMEKQTKYRISISNPYVRLYMDLKTSTMKNEIGFGSYKSHPDASLQYNRISWWPSGNNDIVGFYNGNYLIPPGIVNLAGVFYVLLRCPEIESHLYNSFAYSQNCPGIAMFRLGSIMQIREPRLDFTNFVKKPFHPIGKLPKLTFRFEIVGGNLYDFKCVNHNMLLTLKFYAPKLIEPKIKYTLNPNYNPNYLDYMIHKMNIEAREEKDRNKTLMQKEEQQSRYQYLLEEINKHDYSSSEDEVDNESDDESEIDINPTGQGHKNRYLQSVQEYFP
jgi:hypothetical protein